MKLTIDLPPLGKRKPRALPPRMGTASRNKHHVIAAWRAHADKVVWASYLSSRSRGTFRGYLPTARVTLTRVRTCGPEMDSDTLRESFHGVRDGVADAMWFACVDPKHPPCCGHLHDQNPEQWRYHQELGPKAGVRIEIETREA